MGCRGMGRGPFHECEGTYVFGTEVVGAQFSVTESWWLSFYIVSIVMFLPGFCLHCEGVAAYSVVSEGEDSRPV